jgi:hypothetical protein
MDSSAAARELPRLLWKRAYWPSKRCGGRCRNRPKDNGGFSSFGVNRYWTKTQFYSAHGFSRRLCRCVHQPKFNSTPSAPALAKPHATSFWSCFGQDA